MEEGEGKKRRRKRWCRSRGSCGWSVKYVDVGWCWWGMVGLCPICPVCVVEKDACPRPSFPPLTPTLTYQITKQSPNHQTIEQISSSFHHFSGLYHDDEGDLGDDDEDVVDLGLWGSMAGLCIVAFVSAFFSNELVRF